MNATNTLPTHPDDNNDWLNEFFFDYETLEWVETDSPCEQHAA